MIKRLVLNSKQKEELSKYALDSLPLESCALLLGKFDGNDAIVSRVIYTKNSDRSETTFSIEPDELFNAYRDAERYGLDIVGIFHSHPAPAKPSATDAKYMEINPIPWLIMSTMDKELRVFVYDKNIRQLDLSFT